VQAREGYFREADGGTIFLDEIGEAPVEVQAMLLRVLETGEVQPIGGGPTRRVDVRVLAATDADLGRAIQQGSFRAALYHRLAAFELPVPPLRERRDDITRLFVHFLEHELRRAGRPELFERLAADASALLPAPVATRLLAHMWTGNVRELHNVACRAAAAVIAGADAAAVVLRLTGVLVDPTPPPTPAADASHGSQQLSDDSLVAALEEHGWQIAATARALGISRNTLYARMRRCDQLQTGQALSCEALRSLYERHRGDLAAMAEETRVSVRALQLRLRALAIIR
jgi:two-component system nitrogen regulation response regulator GlnG